MKTNINKSKLDKKIPVISYTESQAKQLRKKIGNCNKTHCSEFRLMLIDAKQKKAYRALGCSFFEFLKGIENEFSLKASQMLREYNAGEIELILFDKDRLRVGKLPESVARVLSENVEKGNRKKVYKKARDSMDKDQKNPTAKQIKEAAITLNLYKQQESKMKSMPPKLGTIMARNYAKKVVNQFGESSISKLKTLIFEFRNNDFKEAFDTINSYSEEDQNYIFNAIEKIVRANPAKPIARKEAKKIN